MSTGAGTRRSFVYRHVVPFEETNLVGNVYFAHYVRWQGHCRERFLATHAPGVVAALSRDLALVTISCSVDFFDQCHALDTVDVQMSLEHAAGNRIAMAFEYQRVAHGGASMVARGHQTVACMRRAASGTGLEPISIPAELLNALRPYAIDSLGSP